MSPQNWPSDKKTREHENTVFDSDTRNKIGVSVSQPPTYTVPTSGSAYPTPVTPPSIGLPDGSTTIDNGVKLPSLAGRQGKKPYLNYSPNSIARGRSANQSGSGAGKHNLDSDRQGTSFISAVELSECITVSQKIVLSSPLRGVDFHHKLHSLLPSPRSLPSNLSFKEQKIKFTQLVSILIMGLHHLNWRLAGAR